MYGRRRHGRPARVRMKDRQQEAERLRHAGGVCISQAAHHETGRSRPGGGRQPSHATSIKREAGRLRDDLLRSIDYKELGIPYPAVHSQKVMLADGLNYLELLTLGRIETEHARTKGEGLVSNALKYMVPRPYYVRAGMPTFVSSQSQATFGADQTFIMAAATLYIRDLRESRHRKDRRLTPISSENEVDRSVDAQEEGEADDGVMDIGMEGDRHFVTQVTSVDGHKAESRRQGTTRPSNALWRLTSPLAIRATGAEHKKVATPAPKVITESERSIQQALKKMEQWCNLWLGGTLKDDNDWKTFEQCLAIPDGKARSSSPAVAF